jgi:cell division transport system permease protein
MMWTTTKRILRSGFFNFWRNGFVSLSAVLVMIVTLFVIGSTIFAGAILTSALNEIKDKVDVNIYIVPTANEDDIVTLKKTLEQLPEVMPPVVYTSREDVLAKFKALHQDDEITMQSLDELGDNPFGATLGVKAKDPGQYESIVNFLGLKGSDCKSFESKFPVINNVNYCQNKTSIDRLVSFINSANSLGFILNIILIFISILITFNTVRLVIYTSKDEISVMRLVGASTGYIKGPFVVAGAVYGFVSAIITLIIFYPVTIWLGDKTASFFVGLNIFRYYISHFGEIFLIVVGAGVAIGAVSSYFAVRKYLKI